MKKITTLFLCLVIAVFAVACDKDETTDKVGDTAVQTTTVAEESGELPETVENTETAESEVTEKVEDEDEAATLPEGCFEVDVTIEGVPDEWKVGIGEETNSIQDDAYIGTTYKDTNYVVSGYYFFVGVNVFEEDHNKLLAYFDTNEYTERSEKELPYVYETVYTCKWGNCQVRYKKEDASLHISWRTFEND